MGSRTSSIPFTGSTCPSDTRRPAASATRSSSTPSDSAYTWPSPVAIDAARTCAAAGWPVTTRKTGGGITPQGPGVLNVALAFTVAPPKGRDIRGSYAEITDPLTEAFASLGIASSAQPSLWRASEALVSLRWR